MLDTVSSPFAEAGAKLIERGWCAVPAVPGTKVPGILIAGRWLRMADWTRRYRTRLPASREIEGWENAPGLPGICIILGAASQGLVAIDIDVEEAVEPVKRALPHTPVRKRGRKGETLFFRGPDVPLRAFNRTYPDGRRERLVDVLGEGRQTVVPPSTHPDTGTPYTWTGELALTEAELADIPDLPNDALERIAAALTPLGYAAEIERPAIRGKATSSDERTPHRELNEHALANLDAWVPALNLARCKRTSQGYEAVADWRASNTGQPIARRKLNLKVSRAGITDFGDGPKGYTALDLVMAAGQAPHLDAAFGWLSDRTGWGAPAGMFDALIAKAKQPKQDHPETPAKIAPVLEQPETIAKPAQVLGLPANLPAKRPWESDAPDPHRCTGLVGKIADWIVDSANYQQPLLAMGAALCIVGTAAGRHLGGPTKSGTHLYVMGIAGTGSGKDHGLNAIGNVLIAAGLEHLVGPGKFTSESAVVNALIRSPSCACPIDEFGAFIARGKSRQASTHELGISSVLRTAWGKSFGNMPTTERAGEKFRLIWSPAMSIYGTSTAEELYSALSDADTTNGFLNRFLLLENDALPPRSKPSQDVDTVPPEIIDGLKAIYNRHGDLGMAIYRGPGDSQCGKPQYVRWRDEFVELEFETFADGLRTEGHLKKDRAPFIVRTAEMAVRIATIVAIGNDPVDPCITMQDWQWAKALALQSAEAMIKGARDNMAENDRQRWVNRIAFIIRRKGSAKMRDIQQAMKGALKSQDIKDMLAQLEEAGQIEHVDATDKRTDTKKVTAYRWIGDGE